MPTLTIEEAEQAIYIDFEGTAVDPPSLLGVLVVDNCKTEFVQYVVEEGLWQAALAKDEDPAWPWACIPASWADLACVRHRSEKENRRVIAWSIHESDELVRHAGSGDQEWFGENVVNAIPLGRKWQRRVHPGSHLERDPDNWMRGRHQLQRYFDLVGYEVDKAFGPGNSAQRIRTVRDQLVKRNGEYLDMTPVAKGKWTKALKHNFYDCDGLRAVVIRCAWDLCSVHGRPL